MALIFDEINSRLIQKAKRQGLSIKGLETGHNAQTKDTYIHIHFLLSLFLVTRLLRNMMLPWNFVCPTWENRENYIQIRWDITSNDGIDYVWCLMWEEIKSKTTCPVNIDRNCKKITIKLSTCKVMDNINSNLGIHSNNNRWFLYLRPS